MKPIKLKINTKTQKYSIIIGSNLGSGVSKILKENSIIFKQCLLVVDKNISKHFISKIKKSLNKKKLYIHFFKANEKNKNFKSVNKILDILLTKNFSREDCVISIGGGITGDISGFAASLFKRGLKFINIPTTLLSQVDSSIGGKTGVNTKFGKNLIGSFYQPNLVISDVQFLKTLPKRELICGYGEILKHSLIANKSFYKFLDKNSNRILKLSSPFIERAIYESCKIKKNVVEKDEKEKGLRKILNFGHTFAHAYEASLGYSKKNLTMEKP
jgi:3-dehydroquinate synthase